MNGLVAARGQEVGVAAPTHVKLTEVVQKVERGILEASPEVINGL